MNSIYYTAVYTAKLNKYLTAKNLTKGHDQDFDSLPMASFQSTSNLQFDKAVYQNTEL